MKRVDPNSGFTCYEIQSGPMQASVVPEAGANVFSIRYEGKEFLKQPDSLAMLRGFWFGVPVLYPTPGRVAEGTIRVDGRPVHLPEDADLGCIHGFVHSAVWNVMDESTRHVTMELDIHPGSPLFEFFPIHHSLRLRIDVADDSVCWKYTVRNLDEKTLPFGFGLHPWLRRDESRSDARIESDRKLELEDGMPTGEFLPVAASFRDENGVRLGDDSIDDVFLVTSHEPSIQLKLFHQRRRIEFSSSREFKYAVLYVPVDEPWMCPENWTCSPNAHNTYENGLRELSGLLSISVGESHTGWVKMRVHREN